MLHIPNAPPIKNSQWAKPTFSGASSANLVGRMSYLWEEGLTGQIIVADFRMRRIAPLQAHKKPMWM